MKAKANYYLYSQNNEEKIYTLNKGDVFDRDTIKSKIVIFLVHNPTDTLEWTKEDEDSDTIGDDILDFYEIRKGRVCKVITKGNRNYYQKLN